MIPIFNGENFVEWTRSLNYILQIAWPYLNKIISEIQRPEPILRGSREGKVNSYDFDDGFNPSDVRRHDSGSLNDEPQNSDYIKAWYLVNERLFSVYSLSTTGAVRSVLLKFELRNGQPGNGR